MHSECNRDRASPTPEGCSQAIELPKQLETVRRAADFPPERHRWNTNEEVAALLIAFDHHAVWETKDVRLRPPSGTMLLYSRKKVRYRKDGFCWKKRKDGKTTREDHMKLKVQGIECIYGCYVHSAILPTFHRRCYWLLQNPDIVLVHYLNVPLTNDNKLCCLPPISLQLDCRDWSRKDLVSQLRPMFASVKHFDVANNVEEMVEKAIESVVGHLLNRSDSGCPSSTCPKGGTSSTNQGIVMFQATTVGPTPLASTPVQSHILQFVYGQQQPQQQQQQQQQQGQQLQQQPDARLSRASSSSTIDQNVCDNATTSGSSAAIHQMAPPHNNPLILNLSQLPGGSNSLLILSNQSLAEQVSILNNTSTMSMLNTVESNSVASFNNSTANDIITSSVNQGPCYDVAEYLNCHDLSIEFDLLEEGLKKEAGCERCDGMRIVQEHSNTTVAPLGHLSMPEMVRVTVSESVFEGSIHEMRNNHFHSCSKRLRKAIPENSKCIADDIDDHSSTVRCCNPVELRSEELIMDELEDILHIVNESFDDSAELNGSFDNSKLVDDQIAMVDAYGHCTRDRATMSTLSSSSIQFLDMNRSKEESESGVDRQLSGKKNSSEVNNSNDNYDEITDFCPEWSYTEGGTKVLVTGPWEHPMSSYSVLFDNISAPTAVVQRGVLRCYAPAHCPAVVCLQVACNGQIISTPKFFEYKSHEELVVAKHKEWFDVEDGELRDSLVKRLVQIGEKLDFKEELSSHKLDADASEQDLINLVKDCSLRIWMTDSLLPSNLKNDLSLLHLAAGLGYHRLIMSLVQWRMDSHSLVLDYEVDSLCTDSEGNTPLMWACAKGQADAAIFLYHWNPGVLNIPNTSGCHPLSLLRLRGYMLIADHLEHLKATTSENCNSSSPQKPDEESQPDIDWIQNSLKTESWMKNEAMTRTVESTNNTTPTEDEWNSSNCETIRWPTDDDVHLPFQRSAKGLRAPTIFGSSNIFTSALKRTRLMKRTSVDILPDYPQFRSDPSKFSKSDSVNNSQGSGGNTSEDQHAMPVVTSAGLRTSNSDPHLNSHMRCCSSSSGDPMISMIDRDLNSPILFLHSSISIDEDDNGLGLEQESVAMEMGSTERLVNADVLSQEDSEMLQTASVEAAEDSTSLIHSNQMMTLASQIIAAMPERIKVSPNQSKQLLMDEINARRDRSSSYGSFSSCSSSTPPVCQAEDSGISTPLEGMSSFLDYRYVDLGTPASTLSPTSTCMQSPYRFDIDSPPPTTAEFTEYFNAPATFMEKDFSQLTLSDEEQRRLYEAAKIIQSFFRKYKDKKDHQTRQQQKEIEAAILIQSYYRRYKQFMYYKRMTQAAVLIQSQFRSYYAQKCFRRSREAATIIQNRYRAYKEHERFKKSRNAAVIIQQRFRKHYQRTLASKQAALANTVHKMMADSDLKGGIAEDSNAVTDKSRNFTETRPDDTADVKKVCGKEPDKSVECKNESDMEAREDSDESQLDLSESRS